MEQNCLYEKQKISASVEYKPLMFSGYRQAVLSVITKEPAQIFDAIRYGIYENSRLTGIYPLDNDNNEYIIYIKKNQEVRFIIADEYTNQFVVDLPR